MIIEVTYITAVALENFPEDPHELFITESGPISMRSRAAGLFLFLDKCYE